MERIEVNDTLCMDEGTSDLAWMKAHQTPILPRPTFKHINKIKIKYIYIYYKCILRDEYVYKSEVLCHLL